MEHTLPALQRLKAAGKCRYVGVTSYNIDVVKKLIRLAPNGAIDTFLSYCRGYVTDKGNRRNDDCVSDGSDRSWL